MLPRPFFSLQFSLLTVKKLDCCREVRSLSANIVQLRQIGYARNTLSQKYHSVNSENTSSTKLVFTITVNNAWEET